MKPDRFQFRLWTLLLVVTLVGLWLPWREQFVKPRWGLIEGQMCSQGALRDPGLWSSTASRLVAGRGAELMVGPGR